MIACVKMKIFVLGPIISAGCLVDEKNIIRRQILPLFYTSISN